MQTDNLRQYLKNALIDIKKKRHTVDVLNSLPKVEVRGISDFFVDRPINISLEYQRQQVEFNGQSVYFSLYERNTNFEEHPKHPNTKLIGDQLNLKTHLKLDGDLEGTLYILFFKQKKKMDVVSFSLSNGKENKLVDCPVGADSFRVALKIEGKGVFANHGIFIEQKFAFNTHQQMGNLRKNGLQAESSLTKQENLEDFKTEIKKGKYNRVVKNTELTIAAILDEFSYECFKYDCNLIKLSKENWEAELETHKPDFLLVESCWQGNNGTWAYEVANLHVNQHRVSLKQLTDYCREAQIKTVFWDKEGQENFDFFKEASSYFDFIFTADENNIPNYKSFTKNKHVYTLAFAAQPQIHNPINKNSNYLGKLAFAGSYYNNKHDLRKKDIEQIVGTALKYGVDIFDRYHNVKPDKAPNNQWPEEYKNNIIGSLNYNEMVEAYKNYDIFLNVNSVQDSKFMFARRVFEVLASRTMIISGPSIGVEQMFAELVPVADTEKNAENLMRIFMKNEALREKIAKEGSRLVHLHHTYRNRLQEICSKIGVQADLVKKPKVTIVSSTQREEFLENLFQNIKHQTYENFEVVIVLNKNSMNLKIWEERFSGLDKKVQIFKVDEKVSLGYCLNKAIESSSGDVIAKFDDDDYYAPNYLTDMIISMDYSNADIVGKSSHYVYLEKSQMLILKTNGAGAEKYADFVSGATLVFTRKMFNALGGFADRSRGEDSDLLKRAKKSGYLIYSNDIYNFCLFRRKNTASHTWQVDENELLRNAVSHSFTTDYRTPITF